jgi:hypothetical protein
MMDRRRFILGSLSAVFVSPTSAASPPEASPDVEESGKFEHILGRPGIVIGIPHGTADAGTLDAGRILCERLGAGGVFVTGFWNPGTRHRINVNRDTEEVIGRESEVVREWRSDRSKAANDRYEALVKEVAQGSLKAFYEIHSNHRPGYAGSIEVSTVGVWRGEAVKLKEAFEAARDRLPPDIPRLAIHVSPVDKVAYPNYKAASSISRLSAKGCAIEHPAAVISKRPYRLAYAACLAEAIKTADWG